MTWAQWFVSNVAYRRDRDAGRPRYVDADPVRARLQGLVGANFPGRALGRVSGLSATTVRKILDGEQPRVQRATAARVACLSPGDVYVNESTGHVPRVGAARRVQALLAMGWPHHALGAAGIANSAQIIGAAGDLITVQRWRRVRDVYDRLSMTPCPSPETRGWAARLGYHPPLAWDEENIDDPTATPGLDATTTGPEDCVIDEVAVARAADRVGAAGSHHDRARGGVARHGLTWCQRRTDRRTPGRGRPHHPALAHQAADPRRTPSWLDRHLLVGGRGGP